MITGIQSFGVISPILNKQTIDKTPQTPIVASKSTINKLTAIDGYNLLSKQISFGINKKSIKNYNKDEIEFLEFRQKFSRNLHQKSVIAARACWDFFINSNEENLKKYEIAQQEVSKIYQDKKTYKQLKSLSKKDIKNPLLKKQLSAILDNFETKKKYQKDLQELRNLTNNIASKYNSYKYEIDGKKVEKFELEEILKTSKNEELRKKAYEALAKRGDVIADDMIKLVKKRNEFAKNSVITHILNIN